MAATYRLFTFIGNALQCTYRRNVRHYCSCSGTQYSDLSLEMLHGDKQGIVVIGFNRPKAKNALGQVLSTELRNALDAIKGNSDARVVILRSLVPGVFCAGADLKERRHMTPAQVNTFVTGLRSIVSAIENLQVPVIAAVDGVALGGGMELALACDIRTASSNSKLGLTETKLAILPGAGGTQKLPRLIGPSFAKELIFTGKILSGSQAHELGIVNHAVDQNEKGDAAYVKALEIAEEIIPNGPVAIRMAKIAINKGFEVDIDTGYTIEQACYAQVIPTKDRLEGLAAFAEKRKPRYIGE